MVVAMTVVVVMTVAVSMSVAGVAAGLYRSPDFFGSQRHIQAVDPSGFRASITAL